MNNNRKGLAAVILAVVFGTVAGVAYFAWTRTPQYALHEAAVAMSEHDLPKFERYVDCEKLTGRFVDDMVQKATQQVNNNPFGGLAVGMFMMLRPQLVKGAQEALERAVETGDFDKGKAEQANPAEAAKPYWKQSSDNKSGYRRLSYVKRQGKIAMAGLEIYDADVEKSFVLELKLRDLGDHWQIVELANVRQFQESLQTATQQKLDELNRPIVRQMNEAVTFDSVHGSSSSDQWGISRKSNVNVRIRNISSKAVTAVYFTVTFTRNGEIIGVFRCSEEESIEPGDQRSGGWSKDANQFDADDMKLYNGIGFATAIPEVRSIKFSDGSDLQLRTTLGAR